MRPLLIPEIVGIDSIGYYIPKDFMTAEEISELSGIPTHVLTDKMGFSRKPVAKAGELASEMGIKAALDALEKSSVTAKDLGMIIFCDSILGDYDGRSLAAKVQDSIGASNSFAFEIKNGCNGGNLGIHLAANMLKYDPGMKAVLLVCSETLSRYINYKDPDLLSTYPFGDAATALILKKGETKNQIMSYVSITDGSLVKFVGKPKDSDFLKIEDPKAFNDILMVNYIKNYQMVINGALEKGRYSMDDIDFLFVNQVKSSLLKKMLEAFNLTDENTMSTFRNYGHMGPSDTLFALAKTMENNKIKSGDIVVLASSAVGFTWGATVIRFNL